MAAHSEAHTKARLDSLFAGQAARAEADILHELRNPRTIVLAVNDDKPARWAAIKRLIALKRVAVVSPPSLRPTLRPAPGKTERRMRMEVRVRLRDEEDL